MSLFKKLENFISTVEVKNINTSRKQILQPLVDFIRQKVNRNEGIRLQFICTHNSRRSHLSQIWAQAMAYYFGIEKVFCYSGGTESTALFPMVADTLLSKGFQIDKLSDGQNPIYSIKYAENQHPVIGFSKRMDCDFNPKSSFAAIMTCAQADAGCPFVPGTEMRIPVTYEDPKAFDNTPRQAEKYNERSVQIATEMYYVFSQIQLQ